MNVTTGLQTIAITKHTAVVSYYIIISSWFPPSTADKEERRGEAAIKWLARLALAARIWA